MPSVRGRQSAHRSSLSFSNPRVEAVRPTANSPTGRLPHGTDSHPPARHLEPNKPQPKHSCYHVRNEHGIQVGGVHEAAARGDRGAAKPGRALGGRGRFRREQVPPSGKTRTTFLFCRFRALAEPDKCRVSLLLRVIVVGSRSG